MDAKGIAAWTAIAISLLWNAFNTYRSARQAKRSHFVTEFKELKSPVDTELSELRRIKNELKSLEMTAKCRNDFDDSAADLNKTLTRRFLDLSVALETLDKSSHSSGTDWIEKANSNSDALFEVYDELYGIEDFSERRAKILSVVSRLETLIDDTHQLLENELERKAAGPAWHLDTPILRDVSDMISDGYTNSLKPATAKKLAEVRKWISNFF